MRAVWCLNLTGYARLPPDLALGHVTAQVTAIMTLPVTWILDYGQPERVGLTRRLLRLHRPCVNVHTPGVMQLGLVEALPTATLPGFWYEACLGSGDARGPHLMPVL